MRRPTKKPTKNRIVSLRLTDADYDRMASDAAREGRTLTDHIRVRTLGLDRTSLRWDVEPASKTSAVIPAMTIWYDGSTGQTWPASNTLATV